MLKLENVKGGYSKKKPILNGINLTVKENEVVCIVGQNGAGKSTLAKAIMNMIPSVSGQIYFKGELINGKNTHELAEYGLGFFMQGGRVFPHLTVEENLNFAGLGLSKKELEKRKAAVKEKTEFLKNAEKSFLNLQASYLSGGEKHQLALALAMVLMKKPMFLILDEPSAGLSPSNIAILYNILKRIREEENISILLIEQNVTFAEKFSTSGITLLKQGVIEKTNLSLKEVENEYFNL